MKAEVKNPTKSRMANLELLRCIAMLMVVVLHFLGKGELVPELTGEKIDAVGYVALVLKAFCIVAVNVYMLISGYFLCMSSFKPSRLLQLWLQVWSYSVVVGLIGAFTGALPAEQVDTHYVLTLLFPVSMGHYWFMTAYLFLYLLLPLLGMGVRRMTKGQLQLTMVLLWLVFSVTKTLLPVRLEEDAQGYDCLWYICLFVTAAYIRRFGAGFLEKKRRAVMVYVLAVAGIVAESLVLRYVYLRTGSLGRMLNVSFEYNHMLTFLAAVGIFALFLRLKVSGGVARLAVSVAPYTLGVYLLHENLGLRYAWQGWFGADRISSVGGLLIATTLAAAGVFVCGIAMEWLRKWLFGMLHLLFGRVGLYRRMVQKLNGLDTLFHLEERL